MNNIKSLSEQLAEIANNPVRVLGRKLKNWATDTEQVIEDSEVKRLELYTDDDDNVFYVKRGKSNVYILSTDKFDNGRFKKATALKIENGDIGEELASELLDNWSSAISDYATLLENKIAE